MSHPIARTSESLGAILSRVRRSAELSQAELGEKMHARQATVSRLEAGEPAIRLKTVMDALAALDLELVVRPRSRTDIRDFENMF